MSTISPELLQSLRKKNFAEFFAGIGLVRAGLERCGWSIVFANDIEWIAHNYLNPIIEEILSRMTCIHNYHVV